MDKMDKLKDICDMEDELIEETKHQFKNGIQNVDTDEAMKAVDMIKDLAEAEEKVIKACYYKKIIESMEEAENVTVTILTETLWGVTRAAMAEEAAENPTCSMKEWVMSLAQTLAISTTT